MACAVLPYLACCAGAIQFQFVSFVQLIALALSLGLWYRVLPVHPLTDAGFLIFVAAVKLCGFGISIYPTPYKGVQIGILGDLALFIIAVLVLMLERRIRETGYGFLPTRKDWRIGAKNFLYFLPFGIALGFALQIGKLVAPSDPLKLTGYFIGALFGTAFGEEFIFRGVLQQWLEDWTWSRRTALILTSVLFGAAHLWFRHQFPNWHWWIIAGTLGWFCGRARNQAGSIRASMVTHYAGDRHVAGLPGIDLRRQRITGLWGRRRPESRTILVHGKTWIPRTRADGLSHGAQSAARRTRGRGVVEHREQGAETGRYRKGAVLRHSQGRRRPTPTSSSFASATRRWRGRSILGEDGDRSKARAGIDRGGCQHRGGRARAGEIGAGAARPRVSIFWTPRDRFDAGRRGRHPDLHDRRRPAVFERVKPLLEPMGKKLYYCGGPGWGCRPSCRRT